MLHILNENYLKSDRKYLVIQNNQLFNPFTNQCFKLYILSNEEIKEGDYAYDSFLKNIIQVKNIEHANYFDKYKKVIATTDNSLWLHDDTVPYPKTKTLTQIPQSFIEHFINEYNKGNVISKVLVEVEKQFDYKDKTSNSGYGYGFHELSKLKLNNNEIVILTEQQTFNLDINELSDLLNKFATYTLINADEDIRLSTRDWIEQNLK
jgi:hypothetical protein